MKRVVETVRVCMRFLTFSSHGKGCASKGQR